MDNPIDFILAAFDRFEKSSKTSVDQQQETNSLLKETNEELRKSRQHSERAASRMEGVVATVPRSIEYKQVTVKEFKVSPGTQVWLIVLSVLVVATFLLTNIWFKPTVDMRLFEELQKTREKLDYHIKHNKNTEAGWKRDHPNE